MPKSPNKATRLRLERDVLSAQVAQLEHRLNCYQYSLYRGFWTLVHCKECKRLNELVKGAAHLVAEGKSP